MKNALYATGLAVLLALTMSACSKKPAPPATPATPAVVTVKAVTVGKAIGDDKRVTAPASSFARTDTIYAAVETDGSGTATLKAKWTYHKGDKAAVVNENSQTLVATGPAVTEFHISKPDGWPTGDYQVEVFLNDASAGAQKFVVQ
jgi:Flp pilus assembly protein CpaB